MNGSALSGSPYRAGICAPFGSTGGAAVHLRPSGCAITCWSSAIAVAGNSKPGRELAIPPAREDRKRSLILTTGGA